ncbi:hypothetical protein HPB52_013511 [Rhipicephalus sanguineus]|uniref:THAP-type domain-containing protein n=1 Tax=Rhipicephalus sanguineus TaxID=34632 RepID=A0A9D4PWC1_RHISA|nr:hypothetical protein HPB52_013511 [Rhipicephalus sanguineus]
MDGSSLPGSTGGGSGGSGGWQASSGGAGGSGGGGDSVDNPIASLCQNAVACVCCLICTPFLIILYLILSLLGLLTVVTPTLPDTTFEKWAAVCDAPLCANVTKEIFGKGGAIGDAAIATLLCMGVTAPHLTGIGGGLMAVIYKNDNRGRKRSTNGHFFSIPKTVENQCERSKALSTKRRSLWLARIKRADLDIENPNLRVCGVHFITGKPAKLFDETDPDWAPSLLLGYSAKNTDPSRHRRLEKRRAVKRQADAKKREAEAQKRRAEADAAALGIQQCADRPLSPHPTGETDADESDTVKFEAVSGL